MTEAHPAQASGLHAEAVTTAERCRRIWGDLLHVPEIEDQDDFFVLGGHSMLATRAMTRLRKELGGVELSASIIFEHPVFHEFVAGVDTALGRTARDASLGSAAPAVRSPSSRRSCSGWTRPSARRPPTTSSSYLRSTTGWTSPSCAGPCIGCSTATPP